MRINKGMGWDGMERYAWKREVGLNVRRDGCYVNWDIFFFVFLSSFFSVL